MHCCVSTTAMITRMRHKLRNTYMDYFFKRDSIKPDTCMLYDKGVSKKCTVTETLEPGAWAGSQQLTSNHSP